MQGGASVIVRFAHEMNGASPPPAPASRNCCLLRWGPH